MRPLGIPTVRDRVVQMAALLILEPIFEADCLDCSHGFRAGRSAHGALNEIRGHLHAGYCAVYDADLQGYLDSIPHDKLLACVRHRISDRHLVKLIRQWLETPVVEPAGEGGGKPTVKRQVQGTPQGGDTTPPTMLHMPPIVEGALHKRGDALLLERGTHFVYHANVLIVHFNVFDERTQDVPAGRFAGFFQTGFDGIGKVSTRPFLFLPA